MAFDWTMTRRPATPMTWQWWALYGVLAALIVLIYGYEAAAHVSLKRQFSERLTIRYFGTVPFGACQKELWWGHTIHYTIDSRPANQPTIGSRACWDWKRMKWVIDGEV